MQNLREKYEPFIETTAENIAHYLAPFIDQVDSLYTWGETAVNANFVRDNVDFDFNTLSSNYEKTVQLKSKLQDLLKNASTFDERYPIGEYFVRDWGGVKTNKNLKETLAAFNDLSSPYGIGTLEGISTWSKYLSLLHDNAHIYDSRVAYAINAINYISGTSDYVFSSPDSRNAKLGLIDIETLFVVAKLTTSEEFLSKDILKHRQVASKTKRELYLPESITYDVYLDLLSRTEVKMNLSEGEAFKVEMLLFCLAPQNIFESLIDHLRA